VVDGGFVVTHVPRVFVVHQPTGRDNVSGDIRNTMDLTPATEFGQLVYVLREDENPFGNIQATASRIERVLDTWDFGPTDWLLLVGNPILIGMLSAIASERCGHLRMLQWSRADRAYRPVEVTIWEEDEPQAEAVAQAAPAA
jgi:hypothetical protein